MTCECPGCDRPARFTTKGGYCTGHYQRWLKHGEVFPDRPLQPRGAGGVCSVPKCGRKILARGYCTGHYSRWQLGDVKPGVPLRPQGSGFTRRDGYRQIPSGRSGTHILEHRKVMEEIIGRPLRRDETVHHRNGERADNRPENLELWASPQPYGQRVEDLVAFAREILDRYEDAASKLEGIRASQEKRMAPKVAQ